MELFSVAIEGFRRFAGKTSLRTNGKVIALVGPNEAGKTSFLTAIEALGGNLELEESDVSRDFKQDALAIVGSFLLDDEDLAAAGLSGPRWLRVTKRFNGKLGYGFDPAAPPRNTEHRYAAINAIDRLREISASDDAVLSIDDELSNSMSKAVKVLESAGPDLSNKTISEFEELSGYLSDFVKEFPLNSAIAASDLWAELVSLEKAPTPLRYAVNALHNKVPRILFFDDESRQLASSYSVDALRLDIPRALASLFELASHDFGSALAAIDAGNSARLTTLEHRANEALKKSFSEAWKQSGIKVAFRFTYAQLYIHVINENADYTALAERSDGLRQFVALYAFISVNRADKPILLIDEAEQKLHYDAQADLVQMLTKQCVASKVIYTTHSAGCLPEDLGHGVRLVNACPDNPTCSKVINKFWGKSGAGFSPLLFGLGATTLAFFPTRHAVCVEGPVDMLLYPTMFREILNVDTLGYQIVPNLSSAARELAPLLPEAASAISFIVDGDDGGRAIRNGLIENQINAAKVIILEDGEGNGFEIEDFIIPELLMSAATRLISRFHAGAQLPGADEMPSAMRMQWLEEAYRKSANVALPKVELAYEILDILDEDPLQKIVDPLRRDFLLTIAARVESSIGV